MTTLESILKYFYLEKEVAKKPVDKFPRFGKEEEQQRSNNNKTKYLFTCKRCGSTSEPLNIHQYLQHRLSAHLARYCNLSSSSSELEEEEEQQNNSG